MVVSPLNLYSDLQTKDLDLLDSTRQRICFDFWERGFLLSLAGVFLFIRHVLANFGDSQKDNRHGDKFSQKPQDRWLRKRIIDLKNEKLLRLKSQSL